MNNIITHKPWCDQHEPEFDQCVSSALPAGSGAATWLVQGRDDATPAVVVDAQFAHLTMDEALALRDAIGWLRTAALNDQPVQR